VLLSSPSSHVSQAPDKYHLLNQSGCMVSDGVDDVKEFNEMLR
jgi:myosin heavy subunit